MNLEKQTIINKTVFCKATTDDHYLGISPDSECPICGHKGEDHVHANKQSWCRKCTKQLERADKCQVCGEYPKVTGEGKFYITTKLPSTTTRLEGLSLCISCSEIVSEKAWKKIYRLLRNDSSIITVQNGLRETFKELLHFGYTKTEIHAMMKNALGMVELL